MHRKLAPVGLVKPKESLTLGGCLDEVFASLDVKPITLESGYKYTRRDLLDYFGS